jgi:glycerophosphoryl diester phosphodiesterase
MWRDLKIPIVIAHRGDKQFAPENTLSAFIQAADKGADAIEFDVKLSADGEVIVLHDKSVDRTTNGTGKATNLSLAELKTLDAGVLFPTQFPEEKIPTLKEVFETVGKRLHMNVELTNYSTLNDNLVEKVVELVRKHKLMDKVLFSSFSTRNLLTARRLMPEVPRGLLTLPGILGFWGRTFGWRGDFYAVNPFFSDINLRMIDNVHSEGKKIIAWTVDNEADVKRMIGLSVDGIITDDPQSVLKLLGRSH